VAIIVYIHSFGCYGKLKGSLILSGSSVNDLILYCPVGCGGINRYLSDHKDWHILFYICLWSIATHITNDERPEIIEAQLTLIFKMVQGAFHFLILLSLRPILSLWLYLTCHPLDYPRYTTSNCWRSVDTHLQTVAGHMYLFVLITMAANPSKMNCDAPISVIYHYQ
jgi:hypothetical protein